MCLHRNHSEDGRTGAAALADSGGRGTCYEGRQGGRRDPRKDISSREHGEEIAKELMECNLELESSVKY